MAASSFALIALAGNAQADNFDQPRTTYGTYGLVEMPSARMAPDGQLSAAASYFEDTQRYSLNFQALPWLETSLRYSGLRNFQPAFPQIFPVYWDRSFAAKVRLFQESGYMPAIAVGINDLIGTGVYSGEYVVASKQLGPFDATIGMGWGRLGGTGALTNPFKLLSRSFGTRQGLSITAGSTNFNTLFHGPKVGLFGGVVWHTPITGLSVAAEYSSDNYALETQLGQFKPKNQMNYGVSYQVSNSVSLGLSWLHGESIGGTIAFQTDPTIQQYPAKIAPTPPAPHIRTTQEQQMAIDGLLGNPLIMARPPLVATTAMDRDAFVDRLFNLHDVGDVEIRGRDLLLTANGPLPARPCDALTPLMQVYSAGVEHVVFQSGKGAPRQSVRCDVPLLQSAALVTRDMLGGDDAIGGRNDNAAIKAIRADAAKQNLRIEALKLSRSEAIIYYVNGRYFAEDDALNRLILVLMADAPARIEKFRIFAMDKQEFDVLRAPVERGFAQRSSAELLGNAITMTRPPLSSPVLDAESRKTYPRLSWNLFPQFRQSFFDPNNPLALQVVAGLGATVNFSPHLSLIGEVEATLYENIPHRPSDSLLPHVRSDLPEYIHQGGTGIGELHLDYHFRLAPDLYAVARGGYLESMFAGAGGEVLWWPGRRRWALGADLYALKQRDFNRLFGLHNYQIVTGHVSLYYQSPWYDLNFELRAGRYLAGDTGITFQATRRFSTGVEIGAYFTKTNVSAAQFGEGSFDKGILIRIPLGWALPIETQGQFDLNLRPLQRDGGQTLAGDATLYEELYRTGEGEIDRFADSLVAQ